MFRAIQQVNIYLKYVLVTTNIQRLATGIDFDRADASKTIEIVFAAAAACQEVLRSYRGF